jgi:hypothetical protein
MLTLNKSSIEVLNDVGLYQEEEEALFKKNCPHCYSEKVKIHYDSVCLCYDHFYEYGLIYTLDIAFRISSIHISIMQRQNPIAQGVTPSHQEYEKYPTVPHSAIAVPQKNVELSDQ